MASDTAPHRDLKRARQITRVTFSEFRAHPGRYIFGEGIVAIEENGRLVGHFVPAPTISPAAKEAMANLERVLAEAREVGLTEEILQEIFGSSEDPADAPRR
jgi:hypothetical protein